MKPVGKKKGVQKKRAQKGKRIETKKVTSCKRWF